MSMTTLNLFLLNRREFVIPPRTRLVLLTDKKVDRYSCFPPLLLCLVQMVPVRNLPGIPRVNNTLHCNLRPMYTLERRQEAGTQTTLLRLDTLFAWIHRGIERLSSPFSRDGEGTTYENSAPTWVVRRGENTFVDRDLSPRSGFGPGCFTCFILDNDPRVRYEGQWNLNQSRFLTTKHSSTTPGSKASLSFNG